MAERMKLKPPRSEPQVNNVKVQMPLHYPDTLDPLVLHDSEANEHVEPRPVPETPAGYTGQNIRLTDGPILDAPPRRMPYADEEPEPNTDQPTPKQANWAPSWSSTRPAFPAGSGAIERNWSVLTSCGTGWLSLGLDRCRVPAQPGAHGLS